MLFPSVGVPVPPAKVDRLKRGIETLKQKLKSLAAVGSTDAHHR
jgi:hypothetical protein